MWLKSFVLILLFPLSLQSPPEPVIKWLTPTSHDFGDILQHQPVVFNFNFENLTDEPITVDNVRTTCGCTASEWSEVPTFPDSTGTIKITFDAVKKGYFYKKIKVFFNSQRKGELLTISGYVE